MASDWPVVELGELAANEAGAIAIGPFGSRMKADVYSDDGVPVIRGTNISAGRWLKGAWVYIPNAFADRLKNCLLRPGDLTFPHRGAIGEVAIIRPEHGVMMLSTSMMKFRPDPAKANADYLFYYFRSTAGRSEILQFASQVGTPGIGQPLTSLRQFKLPLPPVQIQKFIASILGTLDDKIELNRRMNWTLETMAAAIFKSWFIDFDPVHAKAEGHDPNLPADIAGLFPDTFQDSELGPIPKGWSVAALRTLAGLRTKTIKPNNEPEAIWEHYSIPAFDEGRRPKHEPGKTIKSGKYVVPERSVLVSKLNPRFPRIWLPSVIDPSLAICSTEFMPFAPCQDNWRPFVYEMMKSRPIQGAIKAHISGSTGSRQRVKPKEIAAMQVLTPPAALIATYSQTVAPLHNRLLQNHRQNQRLAGLRDALIPKLISGDLSVGRLNERLSV